MRDKMYKIIRHYLQGPTLRRTIRTGLTLAEARAHCADPETSSTTCTGAVGRRRTRERGPWFDSYTET